jgi:hypothetical protein
MRNYDVYTWNVFKASKGNVESINQTNNALENFNRQLNSCFSNPHPNLFNFIECVRNISIAKAREWWELRQSGTFKRT